MAVFCGQTCDSLPACRLALLLTVNREILGFLPQLGVTWYVYFCALPPAEIDWKVNQFGLVC